MKNSKLVLTKCRFGKDFVVDGTMTSTYHEGGHIAIELDSSKAYLIKCITTEQEWKRTHIQSSAVLFALARTSNENLYAEPETNISNVCGRYFYLENLSEVLVFVRADIGTNIKFHIEECKKIESSMEELIVSRDFTLTSGSGGGNVSKVVTYDGLYRRHVSENPPISRVILSTNGKYHSQGDAASFRNGYIGDTMRAETSGSAAFSGNETIGIIGVKLSDILLTK